MTEYKILQVADRPGWAIDRLSKPIAEKNNNIDIRYFNVSDDRYLDTGYSSNENNKKYTWRKANKYGIVHFHRLDAALKDIDKVKAIKILHIHTERDEILAHDLNKFDYIICPTKYVYNKIRTLINSGRVFYIPHGIDVEKYSIGRPREKEVGFVGRLIEHKRYPIIQKAVHEAGLMLIGSGYIEDAKEYNKYNISKRSFHYKAFIDERMMPSFYNRMNLFICLSKSHIEVGPLPVLEAMASGVPVISTKVGWAKDHCEHGKNIIFVDEETAEDPIKLSRVIKNVYDNKPLLNIIKNKALKLIKKHSIDNYIENIKKVYEGCSSD